ncbi:unnamed protein product [Leuciscus chuanchicus]
MEPHLENGFRMSETLCRRAEHRSPPGQLKAPAKQRMLPDKGTSVQPHNSGQALSSSSSSPTVCPLRVDFAQPYNV